MPLTLAQKHTSSLFQKKAKEKTQRARLLEQSAAIEGISAGLRKKLKQEARKWHKEAKQDRKTAQQILDRRTS
jgi:hypothetical protein